MHPYFSTAWSRQQRSQPLTYPPTCCKATPKQVEKRQQLRVSREKSTFAWLLAGERERESRATGRTPAPGGMLFCNVEENMTPLLPVLKICQERLTNPSQCLGASLKLSGGLLAIWGMVWFFWFSLCPPAPSIVTAYLDPYPVLCIFCQDWYGLDI